MPHLRDGLRNTDPFVFGGKFMYTLCQQYKKEKHTSTLTPTKLHSLEKGSVILFGSRLNHDFVLDTVFVVKCWKDHRKKDLKARARLTNILFD
jgi:predicted nucleotidyltransferase